MSRAQQLLDLIETYPDKIDMFDTENDTGKWVVAVDGYFGFFDSKDKAQAAMKRAIPDDMHFDDTVFGSIWIIPPNYKPKDRWDKSKPLKKISDHKAIDIAGYIKKRPEREWRNFKEPSTTPKERLQNKKMWQDFSWENL